SHPGQIAAYLALAGFGLDDTLGTTDGGPVTLRNLIEAERPPLKKGEDPSWLIDAWSLLKRPTEKITTTDWLRSKPYTTSVDELIEAGFADQPSLVEGGLHYYGALSRAVKRYENDPTSAIRKRLQVYRARLDDFLPTMNGWLKESTKRLKESLD